MKTVYEFIGMLVRAHIAFTATYSETSNEITVEFVTVSHDHMIFHFDDKSGELIFCGVNKILT